MLTSLYIENYSRDWKSEDDLKYARSTFGAVVCVPLRYREEVIGVLLVVTGKQGRLFRREEIQVLELLGAQAAVALAHTRLFEEVESARSTLETLLNSTENPVVAFDGTYSLIFANPAALKLSTLNTAIREHRIHELLLRDSDAQDKVYEIKLDERDYLCHLAQLGSVQLEGWVAVMQDVTQLKELDRMKSEMVRMVSHDLKNPLMGALLYMDLLRETATPPQNEMLNVIEQQMDRMQRIIRGVLDVEKVRVSSVLNEVLAVEPLIERAMAELRRQADSKQILFDAEIVDDTLCFIGDADQFQRALVNLMENAIKFSSDGGRVQVRAYREGDQVVFCVEDNGIGIPDELHDRVFDRFFRGRQQGVEHVAGSGLGLSIVKTIAENHRGRVWLENASTQGTRFYISVPLASAAAGEGELK
jgi:signal transduction histidine kinase